ncbi:hypothetical protein [Desulfonatronum sp. SC1]|uniref:hypothetical protein n=1 Tax=Desulfonatronum sp. SC1 TaxID=2109626 RepID=UPI000D31348F|nr:hypothetical protein [Desulfonatronum sp. SC1]PTN38477.1 hypothetical protein C6366_02700 [Desulfonatronum sp. SC1]
MDRFGLVTWKGDTPMPRMLQAPELQRGMGFDPGFTLGSSWTRVLGGTGYVFLATGAARLS